MIKTVGRLVVGVLCILLTPVSVRAATPIVSVLPPSTSTTTSTVPIPNWPPPSCGYGVVGLRLSRRDYQCVEAPRVATDVEAQITGPIGRVRFTQRYVNPSNLWVNGSYGFEVPQEATVDTMRAVVGDRAFESKIYTAKDGERIYRAAVKSGTSAAKLTGNGRWFYGGVANIGPHETVIVQVEYTQQLRSFSGSWELALPTALAARDEYNPNPIAAKAPLTARADGQTRNIVRAHINVEAGLSVENVRVSGAGHRVTQMPTGFEVDVPQQDGSVDQDLTVVWSAAKSNAIQIDAAIERHPTLGNYAAVLITPPTGAPSTGGRDVVFVLPPLGWYEYDGYDAMFDAVLQAINALGPTDRFNMITGAKGAAFPGLIPATPQSKLDALRYADRRENELFDRDEEGDVVFDWDSWYDEWEEGSIGKLAGRALRENGTTDRPVDVVMINDGSLFWTAGEILPVLQRDRKQNQRVHMVVVDDTPNYALVDAITRAGNGSYVLADNPKQTTTRLASFIGSLGAPVVRDLSVGVKGGVKAKNGELLPGHQVAQLIKLPAGADTIEVDGIVNGKPWHWEKALSTSVSSPGLHGVWATQTMCDLAFQEAIEWEVRLNKEWELFQERFLKETGKSYWDAYYDQWKVAYDAAPKDPSGWLADYEEFWETFKFVSPIPEPKPSRDWHREEERLALDHGVAASGLTVLVAVDPAGPRKAGEPVRPIAEAAASFPEPLRSSSVIGPVPGAFALTFNEASVVEGFTQSVRGTEKPVSGLSSDDAASPAPAAAEVAFTGFARSELLWLALVAISLGLILVLVTRNRSRR
jgi:Vault protein inter-alpha-trypsin domain